MSNKKNEKAHREEKNLLEYIVFFCSVGLVLTLLAYLTYSTITVKRTLPKLEVNYESQPQKNMPYLYKVDVLNSGNSTAENVIVELIQEKDGEELEKSQVEIMFVSGRTSEEAWVNFTSDPKKADTLYARIISYKNS